MAEEVRLDKFISETGGLSRKDAKTAISKGRVQINDVVCKKSEQKVTTTDTVTLDGRRLERLGFVYVMLHKPAGVISATEDGRDKTVLDVIKEEENLPEQVRTAELFPIGRLDKDTEGLLVLTNDGELAHRLLAPKKHVDKVYYAKLDGTVPENATKRFAEGIPVGEEYVALPAKLEVLRAEANAEVLITLHEGKFHQVKRMCHEIGCEVTYLKRLSMGGLVLDETLPAGRARLLTEEEIRLLGEKINVEK